MTHPPLEITIHEVATLLQSGDTLALVDCREEHERAHVALVDHLFIPMGQLPSRLHELEPWQTVPLVVYCHHGVRSARVAHWLRANGFPQAQSMAGGIDAWAVEIAPGMPRY